MTSGCTVGFEDVTKSSLDLSGDSEAVTVDVGDDGKEMGSLFGLFIYMTGCFFELMDGDEEGRELPGGELFVDGHGLGLLLVIGTEVAISRGTAASDEAAKRG